VLNELEKVMIDYSGWPVVCLPSVNHDTLSFIGGIYMAYGKRDDRMF